MKRRRYIEKLFARLAAYLLAIVTAVAVFVPAVFRVSASSSKEREFDKTSVLEDLSDEDLAQYPANANGEISLIRFMEYGYRNNTSADFGLYVYIYNPAQIEFSTREGANTINMAIAYKQAKPAEYANLTLKLCSYSTGAYSRLLYKFRVIGDDVEEIYENAKLFEETQGKRRYDVAGVQFWEKGASSAAQSANIATADLGEVKDYAVERTFFYTGYAKGCGSGAEEISTLSCSYSELTTVELDIQHTNYRFENPMDSGSGSVWGEYDGHRFEEVNSVYFSVPDSLIKQYGKITKIKAEWYEYKTVPIFVTKDENAYNDLLNWINVDVGEYDEGNPWRVFWHEFRLYSTPQIYTYASLYNQRKGTENVDNLRRYMFAETAENINSMEWLFYRKNPSTLRDYDVTRAEVEEWAKNYSASHEEQDKLDARKTFWAEGLFANSIDADRLKHLEDSSSTRGYVVQEIAADETVDLIEYKEQSWWEKFTGAKQESDTTTYSPIKMLKSTDLSGTDKTVCDRLLVNVNDYRKADGMNNDVSFYDYCQNAFDNDETPVLFHFANTDYYASSARFDKRGNDDISDYDGYVCQQTCFLDFDVIHLTFEKDGVETVLACVADPIDIFNGTSAPDDGNLISKAKGCGSFDVKKLFSVVILVLVGFLIWKVVKLLAKWSDRKVIRDTRREVKKNKKNKR